MADRNYAGQDQYISQVIEQAAELRLPDLFSGSRPESLYNVPDRHGVAVVTLRTSSLTPEELTALLTFRFAQYLACGFFDPAVAFAQNLRHEPLSSVSAADIHIIAGAVDSGELLCYSTIRAGQQDAPEATLRTRERRLFPIEHIHGHLQSASHAA